MDISAPDSVVLDAAQQQVLASNHKVHALITGAAGSGKTTALLQTVAKLHADDAPTRVLWLASSREVAAQARQAMLALIGKTSQGAVAQTTTAFAFELVRVVAQKNAQPEPRLLTAVAQDEMLAAAIAELPADFAGSTEQLQNLKQLLNAVAYRTELRDMWQVFDEIGEPPAAKFHVACGVVKPQHNSNKQQDADAELRAAIWVLQRCFQQLADSSRYTAGGIVQAAINILRQDSTHLALPTLVVVDNAQELSAGEQRLLVALADSGVTVWLAGDADTAAAVHVTPVLYLPELLRKLPQTLEMQKKKLKPQSIVLKTQHRQSNALCQVVSQLVQRVGVRGNGEQRVGMQVDSLPHNGVQPAKAKEIAAFNVQSESALSSALAFTLRAKHLGLDGQEPIPWHQMVIVCRSRDEISRLQRELKSREVPTKTLGGGTVLKEHKIVRELVLLLQSATSAQKSLNAPTITKLLTGIVGGLKLPEMASLKRELLQLFSEQIAREKIPVSRVIELVFNQEWPLKNTSDNTLSTGCHRFLRLRDVYAAAVKKAADHSLLELLWHFWSELIDAHKLQQQALNADGYEQEQANRLLDAVMELFFVVTRNEEQQHQLTAQKLLHEIISSDLPQDTLVKRAQADAVTITTPHQLIGSEFAVVCIAGLQDGKWPNLKQRGKLIGAARLVETLNHSQPQSEVSNKIQVLHAELRLLVLACSRAKKSLNLFAVHNTELIPSRFWSFFNKEAYLQQPITDAATTLSAEVARLRAELESKIASADETTDANNVNQTSVCEIAAQLARLAQEQVPGADPDSWYGALAPSTNQPLYAEHEQVQIGPSGLQTALTCSLQTTLDKIKGATSQHHRAALGTLLHAALELATDGATPSASEIMKQVNENWHKMQFTSVSEEQRARQLAEKMAQQLASYIKKQVSAGWKIIGSETPFTTQLGDGEQSIELRGRVDRLEVRDMDGKTQLRIVDLKTSKSHAPSSTVESVKFNAQLAAYKFAADAGCFNNELIAADLSNKLEEIIPVLVNLHPKMQSTRGNEKTDETLNDEQWQVVQQAIISNLQNLKQVSIFAALAEHCTSKQGVVDCTLHLIPAVSWQE